MFDISRIEPLSRQDAARIERKAAARRARHAPHRADARVPGATEEPQVPTDPVQGPDPLLSKPTGMTPMDPVSTPSQPAELATIERLGETAVATITVTELSGADAMALMADLMTHVSGAGVRNFVFDLQNVKHMDSSCVGAMVEMLTRLQRSGGAIALVNAAQSVEYLFRLTRLDRLFPICRDVMTAIQAVERASRDGKAA